MWFGERRKKRELRETEELLAAGRRQELARLEAAERGNLKGERLGGLDHFLSDFCTFRFHLLTADERERWRKADEKLEAIQLYPKQLKSLKGLQAKVTEAASLDQKVETLRAFVVEYKQASPLNFSKLTAELGVSPEGAFELLDEAVQQRYKELFDAREDPGQFKQLWDLISKTRRQKSQFGGYVNRELRKAGIDPLPYPDDWNQLIARHYDTPSIGAFIDLPDRGTGDVRLLAAEAIRTDDFTQAQIALAYCNAHVNYRAAVGDVLTAELAKLVMRHRAEVALSAETPAGE